MCEGYLHDGIERVETSFAYNTTYTAQSEKTFQNDVEENLHIPLNTTALLLYRTC
jgi:hypothetical protein